MSLSSRNYGRNIPSYFVDGGELSSTPTINPALAGWSAGGGGSRERIREFQESLEPLPEVQMTLADYIQKYWMYGAAALIGITILKKL